MVKSRVAKRPHHGTARNSIAAVEAAYSLEGTNEEWIARVLDSMRPDMESDGGSYAFSCRIHASELEMQTYIERALDPGFGAVVAELNRTAPNALFSLLKRQVVMTGGFNDEVGRLLGEHFQAHTAGQEVRDALEIFAQDGEGYALNLVAPARGRVHPSPRVRGIWKRVGLHMASGLRLRRRMAQIRQTHDAVFAPDGKLVHAEGALRDDRRSRDVLSGAVRSMEKARTSAERANPEGALALWKGLVDGTWSLVDSWPSGGRRYIAAYSNAPAVKDPRGLTPQERVALRYVSLCASNKEIAFALGLSESTVAAAVSNVLRKLQCRRRSDLLAFADVERAVHAEIAVEGDRIGVLALPGAGAGPVAEMLSAAERDVATHLIDGKSNAEIARARGTSPRTVANQIRGMFDKLGLSGRSELVRALRR